MSSRIHNFVDLVRHLLSFSGWRAAVLVTLMVLAALSEGLGLLLLVPLLAFVGLAPAETYDSALMEAMTSAANRFDVSLSLELVLATFVLLVVMRQLIVYLSARLSADTRVNYVAAVRKEFFASIGATSCRYLNGQRLTQLGQVLLMDCWRIGEAALNVIRILSSVILMLANIAVAVILSPLLALIVLGSISLLTLLLSNRLREVQAQGRKVSQIHNNIYRVVENYMDNLRVAKMAGVVERIQDEFGSTMDNLSVELSGFVRETESMKMTLQLLGAFTVAVALLVAVRVFGASGPELLLLIFIAARFIPRISILNQNAHSLLHDLPAFGHALDVLRDCQAHRDLRLGPGPPPIATSSIGVRGITVVTDDGSNKVLLDDVTLNIKVREMVAIEGPSGAGKSTLADVLSGLLQPDRGDILIDGEPLGEDRTVNWRLCVGYVAQAAVLLQDTVRHNLNWVLPRPASRKEIEGALNCAEISHVTAELPYGLATIIDRREGTLSGGERQRLAIARELLRRPQLLILDEATNALDVDNEARVLDNIRKFYPEMTVLVIAHRPTAIAKADRVIRMADGRATDSALRARMSA